MLIQSNRHCYNREAFAMISESELVWKIELLLLILLTLEIGAGLLHCLVSGDVFVFFMSMGQVDY